MNVLNFNNKLQKIAALTDNLQADSHVSALERDLLLSYIRELYDIALDDKPALSKPVVKVIQVEHRTDRNVEEKPEPPAVIHVTPPSVPQVVTPVSGPEPIVQAVLTPEQPKATEPPKVQDSKPVVVAPDKKDAIAEIFADEKVTDLSDRLSLSPIADLTRSMGINERVFTQQELFGNDQAAFIEILSALNQFKNIDEAKQYLTDHVIDRYGWTAENKVKKAATFVRYIKRKYI